MIDATHTRESELREILAEECERVGSHGIAKDFHADNILGGWPLIALAAMRRISTPIPLTPSDEMVERLSQVHYDTYMDGVQDLEPTWAEIEPSHKARMLTAMRAALNLMGGKK